jgi:D-alanine-D-alanine ligase
VTFIHEKYNSDAIAEEYIDGRELYVSLMGNVRLSVFPVREMIFREVPPDEPKIATYKAKWDEEYRKRWGLENHFAEDLDPALVTNIQEKCKEIYRLLTIDGYARIDLRLTPENKLYFIEANPNPILADDEDFALAAGKAGKGKRRTLNAQRPTLNVQRRREERNSRDMAHRIRIRSAVGGTLEKLLL